MEQRRAPAKRPAHDGGKCPLCFIGEVGPYLGSNRGFSNLGPRVSILSNTGKLLARLGSETNSHGQEPGQFMSPHGRIIRFMSLAALVRPMRTSQVKSSTRSPHGART